MNQINYIYTTISDGQVHVAADTKYIGSVDSYNNCFTQFFAWLFGFSMAVNFDGKVRSVNKESYSNLIRSITKNDEIKDIYNRSVFRDVLKDAILPQNNLKMRNFINIKDRQALFQKLANAISCGDTSKALLMIGKGAELDTAYYDRDPMIHSFISDTEHLHSDYPCAFTVFKASPILQAAQKGNTVVCQFLKEAGANLSIIGSQYAFVRKITNVDKKFEFTWDPMYVPHHHHSKDQKGRDCDRDSHQIEYRPGLRERTIITTQDSRSDQKSYRINPVSFKLTEVKSWLPWE